MIDTEGGGWVFLLWFLLGRFNLVVKGGKEGLFTWPQSYSV